MPSLLSAARAGEHADCGGSGKLATVIVAPADYARERISNPSRRPVRSP